MEDEKLVNCLSADNYKNDGPDFTETKDYLTKTKESFNNKLDKLTDMTSEEKIMESINKQKLDSYYVDLYEELMLKGIAASDFEESQKDLQTASARINNVLNVESEVIDLLIQNKGKWSIENDKIVFQSTETLNQYNELIKKLNQ